jgi:hypothetical protein
MYAHELFAGRTNKQMQPHFRRNPIERYDELFWMPRVRFEYYMLGFRDFVMAGDFGDNFASDAANCFLDLVAKKLEKLPHDIVPIMPELLPSIERLARNQTLRSRRTHLREVSGEVSPHSKTLLRMERLLVLKRSRSPLRFLLIVPCNTLP